MRTWNIGGSFKNAQDNQLTLGHRWDTHTLHLFRALLRQSSYLPDPAARQFFHQYISFRFRQHHPGGNSSAGKRDTQWPRIDESRYFTLLRTARKGLVFLQRANDGHERHLKKVLAMTYGRTGKHRHELLRPFRIPDVPVQQLARMKSTSPASRKLPLLSRKLQALIKSQVQRKLSLFSRSGRPTLDPKIPVKNAWGRPMPMKRVRNMRRRWFGLTLHNVMPPLPEEQWNRLRGLATGQIGWDGIVPRRGSAKESGYKYTVVRGTVQGGTRIVSKPHQLTPRYMRHLWTVIFLECPLMTPDESKTLGWTVRWGDIKSSIPVQLFTNQQENEDMFEGVNEYGKVMAKIKAKLPATTLEQLFYEKSS